jgi:hypothetical protein
MIQEIGHFLSQLLKWRQQGQVSKAMEEVLKRIPFVTGLTMDELVREEFSPKQLKMDDLDPESYLDAKGQFLLMAGELFLDSKKRMEAQRLFEAGYYYYSLAEKNFKTFSFQRQVDLDKLKNHLDLMAAPVVNNE